MSINIPERTRSGKTLDRKRILFYSHDTFGLGHIQRVLSIGRAISRDREVTVLIVSGSSSLHRLDIDPHIDTIKLPTVLKIGEDRYRSRFLPLSLAAVIRLREKLLLETARSFQPDAFVVDNVPLGLKGEAFSTLKELRSTRPGCRIILTLRDILDDPVKIRRCWTRDGIYTALGMYYDAVLVFGRREIFDVIREYRIPEETAGRFRFCGYIDKGAPSSPVRSVRERLGLNGHKLVLVTVGGGGDGAPLVEASLDALAALRKEPVRGMVVLGPDFPVHRERLIRLRHARQPNISITRFQTRLRDVMQAADLVISMSGYNTVSEILSLGKPAILVPRIHPRREQLIRARRLAARGGFTVIHPNRLEPDTLSRAIERRLGRKSDRTGTVDLGGLRRSTEVFRELLPE